MEKRPRIIICRHAESLEDVDNSVYDILSDLEIPLTEKGREQALNFGALLAPLLNGNPDARFYTSPGVRNMQTLKIVLPLLPDHINASVEVEPLIVKQDWGHITAENKPGIEAERYKIGVLRYTFPTGESAAHLIERMTEFKEKIFKVQGKTGCNIVILSHGFEFRVLLKIILRWSEELFESFANLDNCEYRILTLGADRAYRLNKPLRQHGLPITRLSSEL